MTRRMYRYVVAVDDQPHGFSLTSNPRHVATQTTDVAAVEFWAESDDNAATVRRFFQVFGTGHPIPDDARWVGTAERHQRSGVVWHLYEVGP